MRSVQMCRLARGVITPYCHHGVKVGRGGLQWVPLSGLVNGARSGFIVTVIPDTLVAAAVVAVQQITGLIYSYMRSGAGRTT